MIGWEIKVDKKATLWCTPQFSFPQSGKWVVNLVKNHPKMSEQLCIAPLFACGKSLCSGHQTQSLIGFDQHLTNKKLNCSMWALDRDLFSVVMPLWKKNERFKFEEEK